MSPFSLFDHHPAQTVTIPEPEKPAQVEGLLIWLILVRKAKCTMSEIDQGLMVVIAAAETCSANSARPRSTRFSLKKIHVGTIQREGGIYLVLNRMRTMTIPVLHSFIPIRVEEVNPTYKTELNKENKISKIQNARTLDPATAQIKRVERYVYIAGQ